MRSCQRSEDVADVDLARNMEDIKQFVVDPLPGGVVLELHVAEILGGQIVVPFDARFVVIVDIGGLICVTKLDPSKTG